jgi:hypothetical protein
MDFFIGFWVGLFAALLTKKNPYLKNGKNQGADCDGQNAT